MPRDTGQYLSVLLRLTVFTCPFHYFSARFALANSKTIIALLLNKMKILIYKDRKMEITFLLTSMYATTPELRALPWASKQLKSEETLTYQV